VEPFLNLEPFLNQGVQASVYNVSLRRAGLPLRAGRGYRTGQGKSSGTRPSVPEGSRKIGPAATDVEGVALALTPPVVGEIKAGQRAIRSLGVRTQGARILEPKTRSGSRLRLPVSDVRRECRGSVRGALPTVRTARAVCSHLTIICIPGGVCHTSFPVRMLHSYSSARPIATR
jgi:hypothetical protein